MLNRTCDICHELIGTEDYISVAYSLTAYQFGGLGNFWNGQTVGQGSLDAHKHCAEKLIPAAQAEFARVIEKAKEG